MLAGRFNFAIPALALAAPFAVREAPSFEGKLFRVDSILSQPYSACSLTLAALSYTPVLAMDPCWRQLRRG
jgi:K+-transporting ATPase A subunit